jgi:hypothetical protein
MPNVIACINEEQPDAKKNQKNYCYCQITYFSLLLDT